jgi:hypothetical protein
MHTKNEPGNCHEYVKKISAKNIAVRLRYNQKTADPLSRSFWQFLAVFRQISGCCTTELQYFLLKIFSRTRDN